MEPEVVIKCKKEDEETIKKIIEPAVNEYKALMKKEVKFFKDREVPCVVKIEANRYLAEYNE